MSSGSTPASSTMRCRMCGKLHRITARPADTGGRFAQEFLFNCLGCGRTEIRKAAEIVVVADQRKVGG